MNTMQTHHIGKKTGVPGSVVAGVAGVVVGAAAALVLTDKDKREKVAKVLGTMQREKKAVWNKAGKKVEHIQKKLSAAVND